MKPDLNSTTDEILTKLVEKIHTGMERKSGQTGYLKLSKAEAMAAERKRVKKIEDVILSDPEGSSKFLSFRASCSRTTLNRHRARLRREGKIK